MAVLPREFEWYDAYLAEAGRRARAHRFLDQGETLRLAGLNRNDRVVCYKFRVVLRRSTWGGFIYSLERKGRRYRWFMSPTQSRFGRNVNASRGILLANVLPVSEGEPIPLLINPIVWMQARQRRNHV